MLMWVGAVGKAIWTTRAGSLRRFYSHRVWPDETWRRSENRRYLLANVPGPARSTLKAIRAVIQSVVPKQTTGVIR